VEEKTKKNFLKSIAGKKKVSSFAPAFGDSSLGNAMRVF
jgi:deoxyhypusine synthase